MQTFTTVGRNGTSNNRCSNTVLLFFYFSLYLLTIFSTYQISSKIFIFRSKKNLPQWINLDYIAFAILAKSWRDFVPIIFRAIITLFPRNAADIHTDPDILVTPRHRFSLRWMLATANNTAATQKPWQAARWYRARKSDGRRVERKRKRTYPVRVHCWKISFRIVVPSFFFTLCLYFRFERCLRILHVYSYICNMIEFLQHRFSYIQYRLINWMNNVYKWSLYPFISISVSRDEMFTKIFYIYIYNMIFSYNTD